MITITAVIRAKSGHEVTMRDALVAVAAYVAANEPETIGFFISQSEDMISNRCRWTSFGPFTNLSPRHWLAKYQPKQQDLISDYVSSAWAPGLTMLRR